MSKKRSVKSAVTEPEAQSWVRRFVPPWIGALVLPPLGALAHNVWGTELPAAALAPLGIAAATVCVGVATLLSALQARQRSDKSRVILASHSVGTVALIGVALIITEIFGWKHPWISIYIGSAVTLSLTWNVRRLDIFRTDELAQEHKDGVLGELGLTVKSKKVITATPERSEVALKLGDGQTVEDVQKLAKQIGSHAGALRNGVTAIPGRHEGEVTLSLEFKDVLDENLPWPGPVHAGGSIADGLHPGLYRDRRPVMWYPAGNYAKNIAPGHLAIGGQPRVGKGEFARVSIAELATRSDVWIMGSDTRKGDQFLGPLRQAVGWWVTSENAVRAQLKAFERAMVARAAKLGECGYSSWTPEAFTDERLRMPAIVCWIEEAAAVLDDNSRLITELGEASLSAGMFLVLSAQRWSADRVPTSLRTSVSNSACFGQGDDVSASMILRDSTLKAGPDPYEWGANYPGRFLLEANGVDQARFPVPAKGYLPSDQQLREVIAEWAPQRARLDSVTIAAFGAAYPGDAPAPRADLVAPRDYDEEEDGFVIPPQPEPEMANEVNPRSEIPPYEGPEIDMTPEPQPGERKLTPDQRREAFADMLAEFMRADPPAYEVAMSDLVDAWDAKVGPSQASQRPFLHEQINARIELGQMERVEGGRGRYRLLALADVGHSA